MKIESVHPKVQEFLEQTKLRDHVKYEVLDTLRQKVFEQYPKVEERMMYGGIIFSLTEDFGGVFVYKNHVSFEFSYGYKLDDPEQLLEGGGKFRRHLKLKSLADIITKKVDFFVKQIKEFED
ncbi:MAG: DUF1801 domain-containing protein [Marinilabiliaceae bacterium]|nr:DUF1801 domain-containing protein [Marinilabiliaceae bacterium]